jgi:dynein heavy chain
LAQALVSVAKRFLVDIPDVDDGLRDSIAQHMAFVHLSVTEESKR